MSIELQLSLFLGTAAVSMALLLFWFLEAGPRREVAALKRSGSSGDRKRKSFHDVGPDWDFYRLLPRSGLKTIYDIETSEGLKLGEIHIVAFGMSPFTGAHQIHIGERTFSVGRHINGGLIRGFFVQEGETISVAEVNDEFSLFHKLKVNFTNLIQRGSPERRLESDGKRITLKKNAGRVGVGELKIGTSPGVAAFARDCDDLDRAFLFYSMLLR